MFLKTVIESLFWTCISRLSGTLTQCHVLHNTTAVAFKIYDVDKDGFISNGELFQVLKLMVGDNLQDVQLQQIVDKTIIYADKDGDGRVSFGEFCQVWILCLLYQQQIYQQLATVY